MDSRILDQETLGKVVAIAPSFRIRPETWAREIVQIMLEETQDPQHAETESMGGEIVYALPLKVVCTLMQDQPSPKAAGIVIGEMGLSKKRQNDGYRLLWNRDQLNILTEALGVQA